MYAFRLDFSNFHEFLGLNDDVVCCCCHEWVEVVGCSEEHHVTELVNDVGAQESDVGLERFLEDVVFTVDFHDLLAVLHDGAETCWGEDSTELKKALQQLTFL